MASRLVPLIALLVAVGCGGSAAPTAVSSGGHRFAVADVRGSHARIWAVGDSAGGADAPSVARLVRRGRPDRVLYLGDVYPTMETGAAAFTRLYGSLPVAPTPGNHDWPYYRSYWRNPPEWYSFRAAGWRLLALSSETGRAPAQLRWLRTYTRARGNCTIAFWHRPRWSAGLHGDSADMDPYWRALQGHARLVISGHDHDMERFAPRAGLIQLVAGAGGESHYGLDRSHPGLLFGDDRQWGALRIELSRGRARLAFVSTGGRVLDATTVACRG